MKTSTLPVIAFLAAIAAFALLPISATAACIAVTVTGTVAILAGDYGRGMEPIRVPAPVVPLNLSCLALGEYRIAA